MSTQYRFSFGPWNISEGADPFGPTVRPTIEFSKKLASYKKLGFEGVQLHDDDAVPDVDSKSAAELERAAKALKKVFDGEGLVPEFVAPRLWEDPRGIDGGYTANCPNVPPVGHRSYEAGDRYCRRALGTKLMVLWLAREGSYIRESKNAIQAYQYQIDAINQLLEHNPEIHLAIEPKPNEPMDQAYVPDDRPRAGDRLSDDRSEAGGRLDRNGPRAPGRAWTRPTKWRSPCPWTSSGAST